MILQGKSHSPITNLVTNVTGILGIANGGTNNSGFNASAIPYLDSGATQITSTPGFFYNQSGIVFGNSYPNLGQDDISNTFRVLSFGTDPGVIVDGSPFGLTFSGYSLANGRLEFRTESGNGYNVWSTTFSADNFIGGGASLTGLNASALAIGTVAIARGGTNQNAYTTNGIIYFDGTSFNSASTLQFSGGRIGIGAAASATASRLILLTGSSPEIQWINTASANKSWHVGILGTGFLFTETGIATNFTLTAGGGATLNVGSLTLTAGNILLSNGIITQNTSTSTNTFTGSITALSHTVTQSIRQLNAASGVTILEYNFLPLITALNGDRVMRFFRETNTGTGDGSTLWNIGLNTSLEALILKHKTSVISQMSLTQSETGNWAGNHRFQQLSVPGTPTVTPIGTAGATTYAYRVTALTGTGETTVSAAGTTTTGNAVLSASNYNRITWVRSAGCMVYKVYGRTSGAELLMATVTAGSLTTVSGTSNYDGGSTFTFEDNGSLTPSGAQPTANTTGIVRIQVNPGTPADVHVFRATGESVLNEQGADQDFRIEGDTDTNLFFVDASTDRIGIGTASPSVKFDIAGILGVKAGLSTTVAKGGGVIADFFTDVSVGGLEADIYTTTTPASILGTNGDKIIGTYSGNFVTGGTELTQLKAYFGGTAIWDSTGVAPTTGTTSWRVSVDIIRVSATVVRYSVFLGTTGASGFNYEQTGELTGLTLSGTNVLKVTGTSSGVGSGTGDIVGKLGYVEWKSAA